MDNNNSAALVVLRDKLINKNKSERPRSHFQQNNFIPRMKLAARRKQFIDKGKTWKSCDPEMTVSCTSNEQSSPVYESPPPLPERKYSLSSLKKCKSMSELTLSEKTKSTAETEGSYDLPWDSQNLANLVKAHMYTSDEHFLISTPSGTGMEHTPQIRADPTFKVDTSLPLIAQSWYHDEISRVEAEDRLRKESVGTFLVRRNGRTMKDLTLSVKHSTKVLHLKVTRQSDGLSYVLGEYSLNFESAPQMVQYYSINLLNISGAEHIYLTKPLADNSYIY